MNKTFKVVFNKARGALMVANEMTSSVQKKGVKTIVAATVVAAIGMGTSAIAANPTSISKDTEITIDYKVPAYQDQTGATVTLADGVKLAINGVTNQHGFFGKEVSVKGNGDLILNSRKGENETKDDIWSSIGENIKDIAVRSIQINSAGYGIYKSFAGTASTFDAETIEVESADTAFYTSSSKDNVIWLS